jgi:predicted transcriptional regulator
LRKFGVKENSIKIVIKKELKMKVSEIVNILGLEVFSGKEGLENEISGGYASDLLSDVMGNADEGQIWATIQTHLNVMAIASLKEMAAVLITNGAKPNDDTLQKSNEEGIPIVGTADSTYEIIGKLYSILNK